jgi:predicted outer membrane repeat protein
VILLAFGSMNLAVAQDKYVDANNPNPGNGGSWANAYNSLDDALIWASAQQADFEKEIWVAKGTYEPSIERSAGIAASRSFVLPENTRIYGGFAGTEGFKNDRPGNLYDQTVLDGNFGTGRVSHVVYCEKALLDTESRAVIDGFVILQGFAVGPAEEDKRGGGIYCKQSSLVVKNCQFKDNLALEEGGAIYFDNVDTLPGDAHGLSVARSRFLLNIALVRGGAIFADRPVKIEGLNESGQGGTDIISHIVNCEFDRNEAGRSSDPGVTPKQGGGALYLFNPEGSINGNVFSFNRVRGKGSAIQVEYEYNSSSISPVPIDMPNNTFYGNEALALPGGVAFAGLGKVVNSQLEPAGYTGTLPVYNMKNTIIWVNTASTGGALGVDFIWPASHFTVVSSDIEMQPIFPPPPAWPGLGNLNMNPQFVNPALNDFRLQGGSPCISTGIHLPDVTLDLGDVDSDGFYTFDGIMQEFVPFAMDVPSAFFKAPQDGVDRYQGPCFVPNHEECIDMGAMERF